MADDFFATLISNEIQQIDMFSTEIQIDCTNKSKTNDTNKKTIILDPRRDILLNIYASHSKEKSSSHHYLQKLRYCGTIYNKKTFAAMFHSDYQECKMFSSMLEPPPQWLSRSMGASTDYINGSFHFPYFLSGNNSNLASKTINRKKLSSSYFMMVCAQIAAKKILLQKNGGPFNDPNFDFTFPLDESTQDLVNAFLGETNFHGKEYFPKKITVEQTKELLHAWIQVYIFQKTEFMNILNFYLYAGYVVSITSGHGGLHIQQSLPTHPSKWTPTFNQYQSQQHSQQPQELEQQQQTTTCCDLKTEKMEIDCFSDSDDLFQDLSCFTDELINFNDELQITQNYTEELEDFNNFEL
jgi:hypothetical protein